MRYRSSDDLTAAHIGARVTVRHRLPEGALSDVIGTLEAVTETMLDIRDRTGALRRIARADVTAARVHPG